MAGKLQPLDQKFAIVDDRGNPTEYFTRWAQQRQIDIGDSITLTDLQAYLTAHMLREGSGIQFTPSGDINLSPIIAADVQEILDQITTTRGSILYRGLLGWAALSPGTATYLLQTNGPGADPTWAAPAGGGSKALAYAHFTVVAGVLTIVTSFNIASIVRFAVGLYHVTFTAALGSANYYLLGGGKFTPVADGLTPVYGVWRNGPQTTATFDLLVTGNNAIGGNDPLDFTFSVLNAAVPL